MTRAINKKYLRLTFGSDKLLKEWVIAETSELVPLQEKIEKIWTYLAALVTKNGI